MLVRRGDTVGGDNGSVVLLNGSAISATGDLAGLRCGIGGACVVGLAIASP